jgi:hypothetical protein
MAELANQVFCIYGETRQRPRRGCREAEDAGGILVRLHREREVIRPRSVSTKRLDAAKRILAEVFHVRPADVDEGLQRRLVEKELLRST